MDGELFTKNLNIIVKFTYLFLALSFVIGFLVWNVYLYKFGFFEYQIIQTKFILSGILPLFIVLVIAIYIKKYIFDFLDIYRFWAIPIFIIVFLVFIYFYANYIFYYIPSFLGGGQPRFLSIITSAEEVNYLSRFGIKGMEPPEKNPVQTQNFCVAYENDNIVIILLEERILELEKSYIKGFGSIPNRNLFKVSNACSRLAKSYVFWEQREIKY